MSNYNCDYVRRTYDVPAEIGRRVIAELGHWRNPPSRKVLSALTNQTIPKGVPMDRFSMLQKRKKP